MCSTQAGLAGKYWIKVKKLAKDKLSRLLCFFIGDREKGFITLTPVELDDIINILRV
jgi:hypothetical protein